jgi:tetratricopeptide (TPR) repeat protein
MIEKRLIQPSKTLTRQDREAVYARATVSMSADFLAMRDLNLAKTLRWAGKKAEARSALQRVARVLPENVEVHKLLGSYFMDDGDYDHAIEEYKRAVTLSGDESEMLFCLATAYYRAGKNDEAIGTYEQIVGRQERVLEADANLAVIHLENGQVSRALDVLSAALKKDPNSEALMSPFALALVLSGKPAEALPWMLRAVEAEGGNAKNFYNLAGIYALTGNAAEALRNLNLAVDKGYANPEKMARDTNFESIRSLPEFRRIIERMK